ncbi:MAG: ATP-binding cassette domain-containing protein [Desulfovibrionaceae bacterium]|nr:ATP-binding cassette domain-containing protein [Desulfovibrionaceae bacterium]
MEFRRVTRSFAARRGLFDPRPARLLAVNDVSLTLEAGETLGLVGESGCGKSTLARMAVRLLAPSSGGVTLEGRPLEQWPSPDLARRVQMVFQDPFSSLDPRHRVGASVAEPLLLAGRAQGRAPSRSELREAARAMLERVGLPAEYAERYPHEFSGGQRQRVAVARALIAGPRLVVCDEPVSALDASVQAQVLNLLRDAQEERGLTYLFISHDLGVVGFMSDRVAVMYLGRMVELAAREELFGRAAHPYTEALLAAAPVRDHGARRERPALTGDLPSPLNPPSGCAFHPRCPRAGDICSREEPLLTELRPGHLVRCHFPLS